MIPLILGIITISIKKIYCYSIAVVHPLPSLPPPPCSLPLSPLPTPTVNPKLLSGSVIIYTTYFIFSLSEEKVPKREKSLF